MKIWPFNILVERLTAWFVKEHPPSETPLSDFTTLCHHIRPGDVILMEGRSRVSEIIKVTTKSPWSHVGLYIGRLTDVQDPLLNARVREFYSGSEHEPLIIEGILGKGIIITPLTDYSKDHLRVCRPVGIAKQDSDQVIAFSIYGLGDPYDLRHVIDLLRLLFPIAFAPRYWFSGILTPPKLRQRSHKYICSTLLAEAFANVSFPILPKVRHNAAGHVEIIRSNPNLLTPSDFDYSPYFEILKFPPLHLHRGGSYHNLPWNLKLVSNGTAGIVAVQDDTCDVPQT